MIMETISNMLIEMYAVFAQLEIEKKEKRQRKGIASNPPHPPIILLMRSMERWEEWVVAL